MTFGGQSVSCQSLSPYRNPSKFLHAETWGMSLSSVFFEILIDSCMKVSLIDKKLLSVNICERKPLSTPIVICGAIFESGFICTFVIDVSRKILKS